VTVLAGLAPGQELMKSLHFVSVRPQNPAALHQRFSAQHPASTGPLLQFTATRIQRLGQIGQPPFVRAKQVVARTLVRDQPLTLQQLRHHASLDPTPTCRRMKSLGVQLLRDLPHGPSGLTQFPNAIQQRLQVAKVFVPSHRTIDLVLTFITASPMNGHRHQLAVGLHVNMQYIRYRHWFLLLATEGHHPFKQHERKQIRDCRRVPIRFEGYSISYRRSGLTPKGGGPPKWHACVRIDGPTYKQLKAFFLERGSHRSVENVAADFARVPYARYAPVRRQLLTICRAVNEARARTGFDPVPVSALRLRRAIVTPFASTDCEAEPTPVPLHPVKANGVLAQNGVPKDGEPRRSPRRWLLRNDAGP